MDRPVALDDPVFGESCQSELSVDIAREDKGLAGVPGGRPEKGGKSIVRVGPAIEEKPVAVKSPGQARIALEGSGGCDLLEAHAGAAECRIGLPESFRSPEIRKSRVDSHSGTGGDHEAIGLDEDRLDA